MKSTRGEFIETRVEDTVARMLERVRQARRPAVEFPVEHFADRGSYGRAVAEAMRRAGVAAKYTPPGEPYELDGETYYPSFGIIRAERCPKNEPPEETPR
jgi:transposase InsO family protein